MRKGEETHMQLIIINLLTFQSLFKILGKMFLRVALFCILLPLVISWEQSFVDREEAEELKKSVVYLSSYNCDLSPSVCPPENTHSYHPTSCPYVNRRDAQIEIMQMDEVSDVMCLQVKKNSFLSSKWKIYSLNKTIFFSKTLFTYKCILPYIILYKPYIILCILYFIIHIQYKHTSILLIKKNTHLSMRRPKN